MQSERRCPTCGSSRVIKNGKRHGGKQRWLCKECGFRTSHPHASAPSPKFASKIAPSKIYVVTAVQNATPVHAGFWQALRQYCRQRDAILVCVPMRYKNPTSLQETERAAQDIEWWDEKTVPHLVKARVELHKFLVLLADVHINPTAARPLSGLDSITGEASGIVPHTKAEMRTVATPHHSLPKIMITTGAATEANYSESKAGAKGRFHHVLGALVVELDKDVFHLRRINAREDGSFVDLATEYGGRRVKRAAPASALVLGDIHVGFEDEAVRRATFEGEGSLVQLLRPRHIVWHDVLDFRSHNHWDAKKPFVQLAKTKAGKTNVREEIKAACDFISRADGKCGWKPQHVFPFANHPDAFMRWMERTDWRDDLENAEFYLETAFEMARWARWGDGGAEVIDPFVFWAKRYMRTTLLARCSFLGPNDSFMLEGVEVGMHGHLGPNGARGSLVNLSALGVKSITGHSHSPGERDGAVAVGTSSRLFMGYNLGPSSWLNSHCCLHEGGKRQVINVIKGRAYLRD